MCGRFEVEGTESGRFEPAIQLENTETFWYRGAFVRLRVAFPDVNYIGDDYNSLVVADSIHSGILAFSLWKPASDEPEGTSGLNRKQVIRLREVLNEWLSEQDEPYHAEG